MEGGFEAPTKKKLKMGEGRGAVGGMVDVVGGSDGGSGAAGRGGGSGSPGAVSSVGAGGSRGGGSDAVVGEAEGVDLDVHVGSVHDLVVQPPHVEMEEDFGFSDEEEDLDVDVEYFSGSDVDVELYTYKSFVKKEEKKLRQEGLDAYMPFDKEFYRCKYHHNKPGDGLRVGLVQHVRSVSGRSFDKQGHANLREMGIHEALLRVLEPEEYEEFEDDELE